MTDLGRFWHPSRLVGLWIAMIVSWIIINARISNAAQLLSELVPSWLVLTATTAVFLVPPVVATVARVRLSADDRSGERVPSMFEEWMNRRARQG